MVRTLIPPLLLIALVGCPKGLGKGLGKGGASGLLAPSALSARARGGSEIELSWSDRSSDESGFRVEWSSTGFTSGRPGFDILPADAASFVYETAPNRTHSFRVFAVTATFESDPSEIVTVTTPDVPDRPRDVRADAISGHGIAVAWTDVATESGYQLEMSADDGKTWALRTTVGGNASGATVLGLSSNRQYGFRVIAFNANGAGTPSLPDFTLTLSEISATVMASSGNVGLHPSLAMHPDLTPYVAHYDADNGDVLLTSRTSSTSVSTIRIDTGPHGTENVGGDGIGLALDRSGKVHVVAHDLTNDTLRYATNATGAWTAITVDAGPGPAGARPRLVSDASETLHAYYQTRRPGYPSQIQHAVKLYSQAWDTNGAIPVAIDPYSPHAASVDRLGRVHVALNADGGRLYYFGPLGAAGDFLLAGEPGAGRVDDMAIAVDPSGAIHIFYHDLVERELLHITNAGGAWVTETVDRSSNRDFGACCSAGVDPANGRLHVAYRDASRGDLRYARKDPGGAWARHLLDAPGDLGNGISLALDSQGLTYVAYRDDTNGDLKLAFVTP